MDVSAKVISRSSWKKDVSKTQKTTTRNSFKIIKESEASRVLHNFRRGRKVSHPKIDKINKVFEKKKPSVAKIFEVDKEQYEKVVS